MKKLGFIFIFLALLIGVALPWLQLRTTGNEIGTLVFPDFRGDGIKALNLLIKKSDNPVRIYFVAKYKVGATLPPLNVPVIAKVADRNGTLIATVISFPTSSRGEGVDQPSVISAKGLLFDVEDDGLHRLSLSFAEKAGNSTILKPDVEEISATFIANSASLQNVYTIPAAMFGLVGFYLVVRSRKGKHDKTKMPRWGRGGRA